MKFSIFTSLCIILLITNISQACINVNTNQINNIWQRKNENLVFDLEDYVIGTGMKFYLENSLNPNVEIRDTAYVEYRSRGE